MILKLLLARSENWFRSFDPTLNPYLFSINLLKRLESRRVQGIVYDRLEIIMSIGNRTSSESIKTLNSSITILFSRKLIEIARDGKNLNRKISITSEGIEFLKKYRMVSRKK